MATLKRTSIFSLALTATLAAGGVWMAGTETATAESLSMAQSPYAGRYVDHRFEATRMQPTEQAEFAAMAPAQGVVQTPYRGPIGVYAGRGPDHMNHRRAPEQAEFAAMGAGSEATQGYPETAPAYSGRRPDQIHGVQYGM
jgi:hypothetical protein